MSISLGKESIVDWMTKDVVCVAPSDSIKFAKDLMFQHCIRHVAVIQNEELVGIISKNDVDRFDIPSYDESDPLKTKLAEQINVAFIMTKSVNTLDIHDTVKDAAEMLSLTSYHALPVMKDDKLVGIITSTDLIRYLLHHC
jgi:CBS domain-containing protein